MRWSVTRSQNNRVKGTKGARWSFAPATGQNPESPEGLYLVYTYLKCICVIENPTSQFLLSMMTIFFTACLTRKTTASTIQTDKDVTSQVGWFGKQSMWHMRPLFVSNTLFFIPTQLSFELGLKPNQPTAIAEEDRKDVIWIILVTNSGVFSAWLGYLW